MDLFRWPKEKSIQDSKLYTTRNLRRADLTVYREPIRDVRTREEFFLNRIAPICNLLPVYVREAQSHLIQRITASRLTLRLTREDLDSLTNYFGSLEQLPLEVG